MLMATDVISRGMDFKGVKCVINYDFPSNVPQYIHRIGAPPAGWMRLRLIEYRPHGPRGPAGRGDYVLH